MESKTTAPSFTVSLRGYDRMEVDEYLDSLAEALSQVDELQEQNRQLQAQMARAETRVRELEDHIRADTPRTGAILGERIAILLRSAEETASDTIARAEVEAARVAEDAAARLAEAADEARASVARGEEQARRIDASARAEAAEIISEAEARANARTRQIEQWAEQVVSHTRAEEARMRREQQEARDAANAELRALAETRDRAADTLAELREQLGRALGLVVTAPPTMVSPATDTRITAPSTPADATASGEAAAEMPWPHTEAAHDTAHAGESPADADEEEARTGLDAGTGSAAEAAEDIEMSGAELSGAGDEDEEAGSTVSGRQGALYDDEADEGVVIILSDHDPVRSGHPAGSHDNGSTNSLGARDDDSKGDDTAQIEAITASPAAEGDETGPVSIDVTTGEPAGPGSDGNGSADDAEFEAKLEAWVANNVPAEGPRHFKRS